MHSSSFLVLLLCLFIVMLSISSSSGFHHGDHGHKSGSGTACVVKGSHCSCHYCKCENGWVHCGKKHGGGGKHGKGGGYGGHGNGKKYCYGSTEGQYCHCDYCKCQHGYGSHSHHNHKGGQSCGSH